MGKIWSSIKVESENWLRDIVRNNEKFVISSENGDRNEGVDLRVVVRVE